MRIGGRWLGGFSGNRLMSLIDVAASREVPLHQEGWMKRADAYRRAVTRRASKTFVPEPAFRKQDVAKSGQTCVEQFGTTARTSSRSPLASTATSSACTFEARPGKAKTEAPRSINIARAESDLTIWAADFLTFNPSAFGDRYDNNQNENKFQ